MKKTLVAVVCSATLVLPSFAFAQEQTNTVQIEVTQPQVELSTVFNTDDATDLQVATLSETEMKETEGAWAPFVAVAFGGGAAGAWGNHAYSYRTTGQPASVSSTLKATGAGMVTGASIYGGGVILKPVVGTPQNWVRIGPSFSKSQNIHTQAIRWGSNSHYQKQIGSSTLRNLNNSLHNTKLPGNSWRVRDKGHFHLWKK